MATGSAFVHSVEGGRLNPVCTLFAALVGTALVCAGLVFVFTRPVSSSAPVARMILRLAHSAVDVPVPVTTQPRHQAQSPKMGVAPHLEPLLPSVKATVLQNLPAPVRSELDLSMGLPSPTLPLLPGPGPHALNPYSDLYRALNAPRKPLTLKNGQSFRSEYGYSITKIDGHCYMKQALQGFSLSPSVHPKVVSRVPCPGDYHPSMANELAAWAKKWRKHHGGPN